MKRIIANNMVFGGNNFSFKLNAGDEIETFETDKFNRIRTIIQGKEVFPFVSSIERMSYPKEK